MKLEISTTRALQDRGILQSVFEGPWQLDRLISIGKSLHRLFEKQCNGFQDYQGNWDEDASIKADKREEKLTKEAHKIAKELKAYVYIQGDPRGATIYIDSKPIPDNNYTQAICLV